MPLRLIHYLFYQGTSGKDAELVKGMVDYFGTVDLLQYYIVSYEIIDNNQADTHASQIWAVQVHISQNFDLPTQPLMVWST